MIFDHRIYTCRHGRIGPQLSLYQEHGFEAQRRHLGDPVLFAQVETGELNRYVHVWAYESAADREAKRQAMQADPEWRAYLKTSAESANILAQANQILTPAPFFTLKR